MTTINKTIKMEELKINVKMKLSALWIALMLIYIYADILSLFKAGAIAKMMDGFMGPFPVTQGSLLSASILMMIPAVMVFLALALKTKVNRWVNIILGGLYTFVNISNLIWGDLDLLYILCCCRDRAYFTHRLVCMEVAHVSEAMTLVQ